MIYSLKGKVKGILNDSIIFEVDKFNFEIYTIKRDKFELNEEYKLFVNLIVNENEIGLYGFLNNDDYRLFKLLIKINGIGPKKSRQIMSNIEIKDLFNYVLLKDFKGLSKINGVGKNSEPIILFLLRHVDDFNVDLFRYKNVQLALKKVGFNINDINDVLYNLNENLSDDEAFKIAVRRLSDRG